MPSVDCFFTNPAEKDVNSEAEMVELTEEAEQTVQEVVDETSVIASGATLEEVTP